MTRTQVREPVPPNALPLSWTRRDIEQRLMFRGGRHTKVNTFLALAIGSLLTIGFYAVIMLLPSFGPAAKEFANMFTGMGSIPYAIVFFSNWSLAILFLKWRKLALQREALQYEIVPRDPAFVLSGANVDVVVDEMYRIVDEPAHYVLFNRIAVALANLRNLGRIGDVDEILRSQADSDADSAESSYGVLAGFIWAIPVLGFIGTVLGLSQAISEFGSLVQSQEGMDQIKTALQKVTAGLSTAFVTTLQALVAALAIQLMQTFLKKNEQEFLEDCSDYCTTKVVNRLRIMPFERGGDAT